MIMKKLEVKVNFNGKLLEEELNRQTRIRKRRKKNILHILMSIVLFTLLFFILIFANAPKEVEALEKPSWNLCQNLAFTDSERFERECNVEKVIEVVKSVKTAQYKSIEEQAFEFIIQFEWYHDKPYWDHKQWSCGYWMKCAKNTTWITKEKSKWFVMERIKHIREKHQLYKYDDNMEVALISFIYNIGSAPVGMEWYIENGYTNALKNMMRKYSYASWKQLRWLVLRRNAEVNLF